MGRRVLREGRITFPASRVVGARYELEARTGRLRVTRSFSTGCPRDGSGSLRPKLTLGVSTARAGDLIPAAVSNDGTGCLQSGLKLTWQKLRADGVFVDEGQRLPVSLELYELTPPTEHAFTARVLSDLTPGTHRAVLDVTDDTGGRRQLVTAPLQIIE